MSPSEYVFGFGRRYVYVITYNRHRKGCSHTNGFARRICPGKYLAENSIFVIIANILALFNISAPPKDELPAEDEAGLKHPSEVEFTPYLVRCVLVSRWSYFGLSLTSRPSLNVCAAIPRSSVAISYHAQKHALISLSKRMLRVENNLPAKKKRVGRHARTVAFGQPLGAELFMHHYLGFGGRGTHTRRAAPIGLLVSRF